MYYLSSSMERLNPWSKSTDCSRPCNTLNCNICEPNICRTCCITCLVEKHTYCVLKDLCRKIITELGREQCRERYSVFDGGKSLNSRLYKEYQSCSNRPSLCPSEGSICGRYPKMSEMDCAGSERGIMHRNTQSQRGKRYSQDGFDDYDLAESKKFKMKDKSRLSRTGERRHTSDENGLRTTSSRKKKRKKDGIDSDGDDGSDERYRKQQNKKKRRSEDLDYGDESTRKKGKKRGHSDTDKNDDSSGKRKELGKEDDSKNDQKRAREKDTKQKSKKDMSGKGKNEYDDDVERDKSKSKRKNRGSDSEDEPNEERKRKNKLKGKKEDISDDNGDSEAERKRRAKSKGVSEKDRERDENGERQIGSNKAKNSTNKTNKISNGDENGPSGKNKTSSKYGKTDNGQDKRNLNKYGSDDSDDLNPKDKGYSKYQGKKHLEEISEKKYLANQNLRKQIENGKLIKYSDPNFRKVLSDGDIMKRNIYSKNSRKFRSIRKNLLYKDFQLVKSRLDEIKFCDVLRCDLEHRELLKERNMTCFGCSCCNVCCSPNYCR